MKEKQLQTSTGEIVYVYDEVLTEHDKASFCHFLQSRAYRVGSRSTEFLESFGRSFFVSILSGNEDGEGLFFRSENVINIYKNNCDGMVRERSWVLCSTHLTPYEYHCDQYFAGAKTFVFYGNNEWNKSWGGETFICNNHGDVELAIENKPNRLLVFDSHLAHKPAPMTLEATSLYRFTYVCQFIKPN